MDHVVRCEWSAEESSEIRPEDVVEPVGGHVVAESVEERDDEEVAHEVVERAREALLKAMRGNGRSQLFEEHRI